MSAQGCSKAVNDRLYHDRTDSAFGDSPELHASRPPIKNYTCMRWAQGVCTLNGQPCPHGRAHKFFPVVAYRTHPTGHKTATCDRWKAGVCGKECWWPSDFCGFAHEVLHKMKSTGMPMNEAEKRRQKLSQIVESRKYHAKISFSCKACRESFESEEAAEQHCYRDVPCRSEKWPQSTRTSWPKPVRHLSGSWRRDEDVPQTDVPALSPSMQQHTRQHPKTIPLQYLPLFFLTCLLVSFIGPV